MITGLYYFYYRCLQIYNVGYRHYPRAATALELALALNLTVVILFFAWMFGLIHGGYGGGAVAPNCIVLAGACWLLSVLVIEVFLWRTEKALRRYCGRFEKESPEDRRKHGWIALLYFIGSILVFATCFFL